MKVCPVCSESFSDDLKFCDLDGTRLARHPEASDQQGHSKLWSLLGIGLLVGALVLSAVSVFLIPKARVAPLPSSSATPSASSSKPANETANGAPENSVASATTEQPEIVVTEGPLPDTKKKDKAKALANENSNSPALNPKAAAQAGEEIEKNPPTEATTDPAPKKPEPAPAIKPVSEPREPDISPRTPAVSPDPKKDPKHPTATSSKESDKKKNEDKDKKKGGFFRVFKKIFGKD